MQIENTIGTMGFTLKVLGKTEDEITVAKDEMRAQIESGELNIDEFPIRWDNLPFMFLISIIFSLIFSLLAAIFVKQKKA